MNHSIVPPSAHRYWSVNSQNLLPLPPHSHSLAAPVGGALFLAVAMAK